MDSCKHVPVLLNEVIAVLRSRVFSDTPAELAYVLDATFGSGGFFKSILESGVKIERLFGIDLDPMSVKLANARLPEANVFNLNFKDLDQINYNYGNFKWDAIVADLGLTQDQIESGVGFSFSDEALDMRINKSTQQTTAWQICLDYNIKQLGKLLRHHGVERPFTIAQLIKKIKGKITAAKIAELAKTHLHAYYAGKYLHPATKILQALRVVVNDEAHNLEQMLVKALSTLKLNGHLLVITFHSHEHQAVTNFVNHKKWHSIEYGHHLQITQLIKPSLSELAVNPRARSAKLIVLQKLASSW